MANRAWRRPDPTPERPVPRCSADGQASSGPELSWENEGGRLRVPRGRGGTSSRLRDAEARSRLADEHALLLHQVTAHADDVLDAVAANRWPQRELVGLIDYLRAELIGQTLIEERLLFTGADPTSTDDFDRLARDHVRLRYALEALTSAGARGGRDPQTLAATVRGLLTQLTAHLTREKEVLARYATSQGWRRASAELEQQSHAWYPLTHGPVIDLDSFSAVEAIDAVGSRVRTLRPDEQVDLVGSRDPQRLCDRLLGDGAVAVRYLTDGPDTWRVTVTRRAPEQGGTP